MFINTRKSIKIVSDNGTIFEAKAGWIGEVPQWVVEHWYFKALCKDGSVTAIVRSGATPAAAATEPDTKTGGGNDTDTEIAALRTRAAELKIPRLTQLSKDRLITAIHEAELNLLVGMDAPALRQFAASKNIDLTGVADDAAADDLRLIIKNAPEVR